MVNRYPFSLTFGLRGECCGEYCGEYLNHPSSTITGAQGPWPAKPAKVANFDAEDFPPPKPKPCGRDSSPPGQHDRHGDFSIFK